MKAKLFVIIVAVAAWATSLSAEIYSGVCGAESGAANIQWTLDTETGVLSLTVRTIGEESFSGCISLTEITCEAVKPPSCDFGPFNDVDKNIPLYVHSGSVKAYKEATWWEDFNNITAIEGEEAAVENVNGQSSPDVRKVLRDGHIYIIRDNSIYTASGTEVE